jgi:hypothetical protein
MKNNSILVVSMFMNGFMFINVRSPAVKWRGNNDQPWSPAGIKVQHLNI